MDRFLLMVTSFNLICVSIDRKTSDFTYRYLGAYNVYYVKLNWHLRTWLSRSVYLTSPSRFDCLVF